MEITWADGVIFDFAIVEDDGTSRILREDEYPPKILEVKAAMANATKEGVPFAEQVRGNCPSCGSSL